LKNYVAGATHIQARVEELLEAVFTVVFEPRLLALAIDIRFKTCGITGPHCSFGK
jgi:hypothetical protein